MENIIVVSETEELLDKLFSVISELKEVNKILDKKKPECVLLLLGKSGPYFVLYTSPKDESKQNILVPNKEFGFDKKDQAKFNEIKNLLKEKFFPGSKKLPTYFEFKFNDNEKIKIMKAGKYFIEIYPDRRYKLTSSEEYAKGWIKQREQYFFKNLEEIEVKFIKLKNELTELVSNQILTDFQIHSFLGYSYCLYARSLDEKRKKYKV